MIENTKKTKGFIETPTVISEIMHFYLDLKDTDKLLDLTAGKGSLFLNHKKNNCFGFELDYGNYSILKDNGFKNIIYGNVFNLENKIQDESMDSVILNPPYGKLENKKSSVDIMNIAIRKLKQGGKFAIINQSNYSIKFNKEFEYFKNNTTIEYASIFDTELFKPFASVKTLMICGIKGKENIKNVDVWIFDNDKIKVNKRSKNISVTLLKPTEKTISQKQFWDKINNLDEKPLIPPTLQDFKNTIINYMAWESGLPKDMIDNPEKLGKALSYFREKAKQLNI